MNSTNATDRVTAMQIMNTFCTNRPIRYEPIFDIDKIDGLFWRDKEPTKVKGVGKIIKIQGNYASKPVVEITKESVDFISELAALTGTYPAIILKFRDKVMYWRVDRKLDESSVIKRGKEQIVYKLPVGLLQDIVRLDDKSRPTPTKDIRDK